MAAFEAEAFEEIGNSNEFRNKVDTKGRHSKDATTIASLVASRNAQQSLLKSEKSSTEQHSLRTQEVHQVVAQLVSGQHVPEAEVGCQVLAIVKSCGKCQQIQFCTGGNCFHLRRKKLKKHRTHKHIDMSAKGLCALSFSALEHKIPHH